MKNLQKNENFSIKNEKFTKMKTFQCKMRQIQ